MMASQEMRPMRLIVFGVFVTAFTVLLFLLAPLVWSVMQLFIIVALLALALETPVRWLTARRIPRTVAVILVILCMLLIVALFMLMLVPRVIEQVQQIIIGFPVFWDDLTKRFAPLLQQYPSLADALSPDRLIAGIRGTGGSLLRAASSVFTTTVGVLTTSVLVLVATVYTLLHPRPLLLGLRGLFPTSWWPKLDRICSEVAVRVRGWVVGTFVLGVIIGIMDYVALTLINLFHGPDLPFTITFAVIAGALEIFPVVGPLLATVLPALVGFSIDPMLGVLVVFAFFLVQQLENTLIAPYVMHRAVNLHPVSLLFALVLLSGIFGLFGAIIAVPVAAVIKVLYDEWYYPLIHNGSAPLPADTPTAPAPSEEGEGPAEA